MRLQDRLPDGVTVHDKFYRCDFDFRNVLAMMDVLDNDNGFMQAALDYNALRCIMHRPPRDPVRAHAVLDEVQRMLFTRNTKQGHKPGQEQEQEQKQKQGKEPKKPRVTDFDQDAGMIRAAFLQAYGINLYTDRIHWIEFSELLNAIPEGSRYSQVVGIRIRDVPAPTKYNAEERAWLINAKASVALDMTEEEQQEQYEQQVGQVFGGLLAWAESFKTKDKDNNKPQKEVNDNG